MDVKKILQRLERDVQNALNAPVKIGMPHIKIPCDHAIYLINLIDRLQKVNQTYCEVLADLLFAYVNKDDDFPHDFEVDAVKNAVQYLLENYQGDTYTKDFFMRAREDILDKRKHIQ